MVTVKNYKINETGEVMGRTDTGVTVKKPDGGITWWSNKDIESTGAKVPKITWKYNRYGHVEIWKGTEMEGASDIYLQVDTDVEEFFKGIGLDVADVGIDDWDTVDDPGYFISENGNPGKNIEFGFKTPWETHGDLERALFNAGITDVGSDLYGGDPYNYVSVIARMPPDKRDLAIRVAKGYNGKLEWEEPFEETLTPTSPERLLFSKAIRKRLEKAGKREAVDFKANVCQFIDGCLADGGIPTFTTKYGGQRWSGNMVLGKCYGGHGRQAAMWFKNVPLDIIERMEAGPGDWKWLQQTCRGGSK